MLSLPKPHLCFAAAIASLAGPGAVALSAQRPAPSLPRTVSVPLSLHAGGQLASFKSDADFLAFLQKRQKAVSRRADSYNSAVPAPPPPAAAAESIVVTGSTAKSSDRITNTQEADVDEGGIV